MTNKKRLWNQNSVRKNTRTKLNSSFFGALLLLTIFILFSINTSFAQPLASGKNKFVGNVISYGNNIRPDFPKYWNQVTPENAGKWGSVEGTQGSYGWTQLDNIYNYALTNHFTYKHHALIWGQQYPSFVATLDSAALYQEIENWIKFAGQRYPNADLVDVVNEPLHSFTGTALNIVKALGGGGTTGWDWVIKAFQLARNYWSSTTKLLINEYSVINDGNANTNYINLINILKSRGLVDGIGIQAHNFEVNGGASVSALKTNLDKIAAIGLPIYISEFDINNANDNSQLQKYQSIFPMLYEEPGVAGITLWGYVYNQIWQVDAYLIDARNAERPALQWLRTYLAAPYRPLLISPNATTNESLTPRLTWHSSLGATSYHIQIANYSSFSPIVLDTTTTDTVLTIKNLSSSTRYYWRASSINDKGESPFTDALIFTTKDVVAVEKIAGIPTQYSLLQNYPNPFNPSTVINYQIPVSSYVTLKMYDNLGREVKTLVNEFQNAGNYNFQFSILNSKLSSGVYFYTLRAGNYIETKKMMLMK